MSMRMNQLLQVHPTGKGKSEETDGLISKRELSDYEQAELGYERI